MSWRGRARERASELDSVGASLLRELEANEELFTVGSFRDQIGVVAKMAGAGRHKLAFAYSALVCEYPIQVKATRVDLDKLLDLCIDLSPYDAVVRQGERVRGLQTFTRCYMEKNFPLKADHPGASNKVNVYTREIVPVFAANYPGLFQRFCCLLPSLEGRLYDDQLSALLLYSAGLSVHCTKPVELSCHLVLNPKIAKSLGTVLKSLGLNALAFGAVLCEANTLQGRGVAPADLEGEARRRVTPDDGDGPVANFGEEALRSVVRRILDEELNPVGEFETPEKLWESRWEWCVNGSHAKVLERIHPHYGVKSLPGVSQWYRRMFAETLREEPITKWDGEVLVSASPKLEHGKTRSIFACDTVSYFCFEHLLRPCERAWRGRRVVLDPGGKGIVGMVSRVQQMKERGVISMMLDYDDFNSQHSLRAQQIVIEELGIKTGYDPTLLAKLVGSFDRMRIFVKSREFGYAKHSLMSGHRATTFLNSVLNAAYIRLAVGEDEYARAWAMHVGDDVYMSVTNYASAEHICKAMRDSPCTLNPSKQSTGSVCAEFLRIAVTDHDSRGYYARAVSSVVSGNWVTEVKLGPREGLTTMVQSARTLMNRSQNWNLHRLLVPSCVRMTGSSRQKLGRLLGGSYALGGGPVYGPVDTVRWYEVDEKFERTESDYRGFETHATDDYLSKRVTPNEAHALVRTGGSVKPVMLESSYGKALRGDKLNPAKFRVRGPMSRKPYGSIDIRVALKKPTVIGCLSESAIYNLIRYRFNAETLAETVRLEGGNPGARDLNIEAWGAESRTICVCGVIPYADASSVSRRTLADMLIVSKPCYA